jgi:hypothetical protein
MERLRRPLWPSFPYQVLPEDAAAATFVPDRLRFEALGAEITPERHRQAEVIAVP